MAAVIERVGPCRFATADGLSHFEAVSRSIIYQQLSGKAAATIHGRFQSLFDGLPYGDVGWSRVALRRDEVLAIRYIDYDYWVELSGGTRLPADAAQRIRAGQANPEHAANFLRIAATLNDGASYRNQCWIISEK